MSKRYARLTQYGDLCIPLALLEKISEQGYIVNTRYESGGTVISSVAKVEEVTLHEQTEINAIIAQQEISS